VRAASPARRGRQRGDAEHGGCRQQHDLRDEYDRAPLDDVGERAANSPNRSAGTVLAVCTSATISADGVNVAISHAATVACIV